MSKHMSLREAVRKYEEANNKYQEANRKYEEAQRRVSYLEDHVQALTTIIEGGYSEVRKAQRVLIEKTMNTGRRT